MIIQCDSCNAKFRIDDSKISEKGVKIKCTKCQNVFIVKPQSPVELPPSEPPKEIQFDLEKKPEIEAPKKEMTEEERLADEWSRSISFGEEKTSLEGDRKEEFGGFEVTGAEAEALKGAGGEEFSFLFGEEEKKEAAPASVEIGFEEKATLEHEITAEPKKEEPVFELPVEEAHEREAISEAFKLELPEGMEPAQEEGKEESVVLGEAKPSYSKLMPVFGAILVLIGIGIFYLAGGFAALGSLFASKESLSENKFDLVDLKGYYTENQSIGRLFVIEGRITSTFDNSREFTGVKVSIFDTKGKKAQERVIAPGIIISNEDLKSISKEELEKRFRNKERNVLPAKGSMPFMAVFSSISGEPKEFGVELVL